MANDTRIINLERLLAAEPSSIAFAQLAEWYRRAGQLDDAVRVCRAGLKQYPSHHSARITLARALLAQGLAEESRAELDRVQRDAPDNVAVKGALEELHRLTGGKSPAGDDQRVLNELESWLAAIQADRFMRSKLNAATHDPLRT